MHAGPASRTPPRHARPRAAGGWALLRFQLQDPGEHGPPTPRSDGLPARLLGAFPPWHAAAPPAAAAADPGGVTAPAVRARTGAARGGVRRRRRRPELSRPVRRRRHAERRWGARVPAVPALPPGTSRHDPQPRHREAETVPPGPGAARGGGPRAGVAPGRSPGRADPGGGWRRDWRPGTGWAPRSSPCRTWKRAWWSRASPTPRPHLPAGEVIRALDREEHQVLLFASSRALRHAERGTPPSRSSRKARDRAAGRIGRAGSGGPQPGRWGRRRGWPADRPVPGRHRPAPRRPSSGHHLADTDRGHGCLPLPSVVECGCTYAVVPPAGWSRTVR